MSGPRHDHERSDADVGVIARFGLGVLVLTVVTLAAMAGFYRYLGDRPRPDRPPPSPLAGTRAPFTGPRLEVSETAAIEALRVEEEAVLTTYGWADRQRRRVRLPIAQAMEVIVEREMLGTRQGRVP